MSLAPLARRMERQTYRAADAVVTVSSALKEYVVRMGAPADRLHVVPNGARPDLFDPAKADGAMIREQLDLPARAVRSEERRVGKERRSRGSREDSNDKSDQTTGSRQR